MKKSKKRHKICVCLCDEIISEAKWSLMTMTKIITRKEYKFYKTNDLKWNFRNKIRYNVICISCLYISKFLIIRYIGLKIVCFFSLPSQGYTNCKWLISVYVYDTIFLFFFICNSTRLDDDDKLSLIRLIFSYKKNEKRKEK
jgi:hypothetical protein